MTKILDKPRNNTHTEEETTLELSDLIRYRYKHQMSYQQIADKLGCHKTSVMRKLQKYIGMLPQADEISAWEQNKTAMLNGLELKLFETMCNKEKLKDASLNNAAYAFQQVCTQNNLSKGLPTERIDSLSVTATLSELERRKADLLKCITIQDVVPDKDSVKQ